MGESALGSKLGFLNDEFIIYSSLKSNLAFTNADFQVRTVLPVKPSARLAFTNANFNATASLRARLSCDTALRIYSALSEKTPLEFPDDMDVPVITSLPFDGQLGVDVAVEILLQSNEPIRKADGTEITSANVVAMITFQDDTPASVPFTASINTAKTTITIQATGPLAFDTEYTLTFSGFEDYSGNEVVSIQTSFTTKTSNSVIGQGLIGPMIIN